MTHNAKLFWLELGEALDCVPYMLPEDARSMMRKRLIEYSKLLSPTTNLYYLDMLARARIVADIDGAAA